MADSLRESSHLLAERASHIGAGLKLGQGSVVELAKFAGETLDVLANQKLIAKGEVVVINDKYGIRLTEIISPMERIVKLK